MKRLALAVVGMTALAVAAEAGDEFEPVHLVNRVQVYHYTHYRRGPEKGKHPGSNKSTAEARQAKPEKPTSKPTPQPARAD